MVRRENYLVRDRKELLEIIAGNLLDGMSLELRPRTKHVRVNLVLETKISASVMPLK